MASGGTDDYSQECPICVDVYTDPRILTCGHSVCLQCIQNIAQSAESNNKFPCPVCRQQIDIPIGGVKNLTTNFALMNLKASPKCGTHKKEKIVLFCKDCNVGLCVVCLVEEHQTHRYVYIEDDKVKQDTIEQLSTSQHNINHKILDLEKTYHMLEEKSKQLKDYDKKCRGEVEEYCNRKLKELKDIEKAKLAAINDFYNKNELKLSTARNQCQQQKQTITQELEQSMPSLLDDQNLKRLNCVKIMSDLESKCNAIEVKVPHDIQYLVWKGDDKSLPDNVLGVSEHQSLYLPSTYNFKFNINDIKDLDKCYYSQNKYNYYGIIWSCIVKKNNNGYLGVYSVVLTADNPELDSCVIDDQFTLVNTVKDQSVIMKSQNTKYKTDGLGGGWKEFIQWTDLSDTTNGFVDTEGQFIVKLDINYVSNITKKNK